MSVLTNSKKRVKWWLLAAMLVCGGIWLSAKFRNGDAQDWPHPNVPVLAQTDSFAGSQSCEECHVNQHASWSRTYHRTMTQVVTPETVLGDFNDVELQAHGRSFRLSRQGDRFLIDMPNPDWESKRQDQGFDLPSVPAPRSQLPVVMSTGSHHYQTYWVPSQRGRELRQVPWVFLREDARWVPVEDTFIRPPDAPRRFAIWNTSCIQCHAVAGRPGKDPVTGDLSSDVAELGISCEACHGPARNHIEFHKRPASERRQQQDPIVNPAKCSNVASSEICGQCHSYFVATDEDDWWKNGYSFRAGHSLSASHKMTGFDASGKDPFLNQAFWPDGTVRVGGREFMGLRISKCFTDGEASCISCHSMHESKPEGQLAARMDRDAACLQCHKSLAENIEQHTHHPAASAGSRCYNCHMPHTSFALFKAIRSHRIDIPRVSVQRPNACNLCHADRSLAWTADKMHEWYNHETPALSDDQSKSSAVVLGLLQGDAVERAIACWTLGWEPSKAASVQDWQIPFLVEGLRDRYSVVRYVAARSLRSFEGFEDTDFDFIAPQEEREKLAEQIRENWYSGRRVPDNRAILMKDGQIDAAEFSRLLQGRSDPDISLPE